MASQGLGLSRWTEKGGSYRTIQRFFNTQLLWCELHWCLLRSHVVSEDDVYLLAGDEVVVTKAGKQTFGLDRFFSSLYGHPVKGLCFFSLSLISVKRRTSYPLGCQQVVRSAAEKAATKAKRERAKNKPAVKAQEGRPKGSKNRDKVNVVLSAHLQFVQGLLRQVLSLVRSLICVNYLVLDGAYGYNEVMQLVRQLKLSLISKLGVDPVRWLFRSFGATAGRGQNTHVQQIEQSPTTPVPDARTIYRRAIECLPTAWAT